ncbi:glycosyltransferase [Corallibacter sp.]|uniref:glycosyltransferase n=1 Tax=Corallibacter sp. TaxID=2038084 RepID=UPI003AB3264A
MTKPMSNDTPLGVSIIICTYNGKTRLPDTLQHIVLQKIKVPCEIILVDNASTDGSKKLADNWWDTNKKDTPITYQSFSQPKPGKSYAQELGYDKAKYSLLLVCDDDNWLCDTYVQTAFDIMQEHPEIGALGGWCDAVFEDKEPEWFQHYSKYYAVGKQAMTSGDITNTTGYLYGAGMVLRKTHWVALLNHGFQHILSCRKGTALSSGGDTEYCYALQLLGYKIWYDERLYFQHYMTAGRLNLKYLSRLRKAMTYSNFVILAYKDVLTKSVMSKTLRRQRVFVLLKNGLLKNVYRLCLGNYEQKMMSYTYFKKLYYLVFNYKVYLQNVSKTQQWINTYS